MYRKRLMNLHPYATYHWQTQIDYDSEEGHAMIVGKGTEATAAGEYAEEGNLSVKNALYMLDGYGANENQFIDQEGFRAFLRLRLTPMLRCCGLESTDDFWKGFFGVLDQVYSIQDLEQWITDTLEEKIRIKDEIAGKVARGEMENPAIKVQREVENFFNQEFRFDLPID